MNKAEVRGENPPRAGKQAPDVTLRLLEDPALARVFDALDRGGDETRIVGGALRDALLGRPLREIDLATTARPDVVIERAQAAGLRTIPTGLSHGTVTLIAEGKTFEVTSLREDIETDGRHAKVRFGRDFEIDALRRDFTMNALFLARDGQLFDFVGGLEDIKARRVRFIGEPDQRIAEDYLRILRFFRFSAEFGEGALDPSGLLASIRARVGLCRLSRERVRAELIKLFCARRAAEIVTEMSDAGLLGPLLASAPNPARLRRVGSVMGASTACDPMLRLAALCLYVQEDAVRLRDQLRLSNAEFQRLDRLAIAQVRLHGREEPPEQAELRTLLYQLGPQAALDALILTQANACAQQDGAWDRARSYLKTTPQPRLTISGADLLACGVTPGRAVGRALKEFESRWIAAGLPQDEKAQAGILDEVIACLE